jgi:thiamine transport system permease protein
VTALRRVAPARRTNAAWALVALVPIAFFTIFFVYPLGSIIERGAQDGSVGDVLTRASTREIAWFTLWQAVLSAALTLVVGLPAAWAIARFDFAGRRALRAALVVPFVLPTLVVGAALQAVFERVGLDDGRFRLDGTVAAILIAHMMLNVAVVVRVVGGYWGLLDPRAEEAARMLGAGRVRTALEVTLPRLAPAIWSATVIVFLFCFTSFGVILTVGGPAHPTLETEIWRYATQRTDFTTAAALAIVQLLAVVALVVAGNMLERRASGRAPARRPMPPRRARNARQRCAMVAALAPSVALVVLPLGVLVERSLHSSGGYGFGNYRALAERSDRGLFVPPLEAVGNSLRAALLAAVIAVAVGTLASAVVVLARHGGALDAALMVPLGTSAVTLGFGILIALDEPPLDLRTSWMIVPIAQALVGIPFVLRSMVPALRAVDPRLRDAAAVLGATPRHVRLEVDVPIARRALLVGAAFAFAVSLGEFGATSFLARPDAPTVPVAMFRLLGQPSAALRGQAMALGVILAALTAASVFVIERLRPKDALGW